jgi:hypothetical protein
MKKGRKTRNNEEGREAEERRGEGPKKGSFYKAIAVGKSSGGGCVYVHVCVCMKCRETEGRKRKQRKEGKMTTAARHCPENE